MPPTEIVYQIVLRFLMLRGEFDQLAELTMEWFKELPSEDSFSLAVYFASTTKNINSLSYLKKYAETYCTDFDTLKMLQAIETKEESLSEKNDSSSESEQEENDTKEKTGEPERQ